MRSFKEKQFSLIHPTMFIEQKIHCLTFSLRKRMVICSVDLPLFIASLAKNFIKGHLENKACWNVSRYTPATMGRVQWRR